ncbi:MAG: hypothetical protein AAGM67_20720, partial [Bacteroidota bacterium]
MEGYLEGLPETSRQKVEYEDSASRFKFGSSQLYESMYKVMLPAQIGNTNLAIKTDVVEADIPLLLSKNAMKKAGTQIDFVTDKVTMFGEEQDVVVTTSGHYAIPLNNSLGILRKIEKSEKVKITLVAEKEEDKHKMALKLHSQFGHAGKDKLMRLIRRAGRGDDKDLVKNLELVEKECTICMQYAKPGPRPVVGLPHATQFNQTVAMDLFFFQGKPVLHLIDHLTRFSAARICNSKKPRDIINAICDSWISIFGPPRKFLSDNGGE